MSAMSKLPILELRHIECEPPAGYSSALDRLATVTTVRCWQDPLPGDPTAYAGIIAMGGPMGVGDADSITWLASEIAFLREALDAGVPVWGVCLGSQLLAAALDAEVYPGELPEVGVLEVTFADDAAADPVWGEVAGAAATLPALQWHSDTFDLPAGSRLLASSDSYPHQMFRYDRSYGIQFHLEADSSLASSWLDVDDYRHALEQVLGDTAAPGLIADIAAVEGRTIPVAHDVMTRWLALLA